jgi:glucose/arabinose dehydrogenase
MKSPFCFLLVGIVPLLLSAPLVAEPPDVAHAQVHHQTLTPPAATNGDALLRRLSVPPGFRLSIYASGLGHPRMIEAGLDGTVYVTRRDEGDVLALRDTDGDGRADHRRTFLNHLDGVHGVALHAHQLYLASSTTIWRSRLTLPVAEAVVTGLPDGGQHPNRMVRFGPDGKMYVSIGSSCNDCAEENQLERGTIVRYAADGSSREFVAKGLRNTIGFDWQPTTGALWGMDHGSDFRGDSLPPEELNLIDEGANYGWPICYADRRVDPMTNALPERLALKPGVAKPSGQPMTREAYCALTQASTLTLRAHSAPMAMRFHAGNQFPADYRGDAFVALHGSWNRRHPAGYRVVRLHFSPEGQPQRFDDFVTGFVGANDSVVYGRPVGIAFLPDGAMLVSDDLNGSIYRIDYIGVTP